MVKNKILSNFRHLVVLVNIANYVFCDILCQTDIICLLRKKYGKKHIRNTTVECLSHRRDSMLYWTNHNALFLMLFISPYLNLTYVLTSFFFERNVKMTLTGVVTLVLALFGLLSVDFDKYYDRLEKQKKKCLSHWRIMFFCVLAIEWIMVWFLNS